MSLRVLFVVLLVVLISVIPQLFLPASWFLSVQEPSPSGTPSMCLSPYREFRISTRFNSTSPSIRNRRPSRHLGRSVLPTAGATFFVRGIHGATDVLVGPVAGASGAGELASLEFAAVGFGSSNLTLSNVFLLDSSLNDIAFSTQPGRVNITPEPATLPLLSAIICGVLR